MSWDLKAKLYDKLKKNTYFTIQIDESMDITIMPQLLCYVRYEDGNTVGEGMLFCELLPAHTTAEEIFL